MAAIGEDAIAEMLAAAKESNDPNRLLLLNILANQKLSDEKQENRFNSIDASIQASKLTLEKYIEDKDTALTAAKSDIVKNTTELNVLQTSVTSLQGDLAELQDKYEATQRLLDETTVSMDKYVATIEKLDLKFQRDEEEVMRCQLIIDGVKESGTKRPKSIITSLLKDLEVEFSDSDIKSAYRLGPVNDKASRPRSIKVQFLNNQFNFDIFKNISKLKGKEAWKGVHISDAVTQEEQEKRCDMRCIFAAGKAKGVNIELKGSSVIIDGTKYSHTDIYTLPKGLSINQVKIVATKDSLAFQSHHTFLSNMFPCKISYDGIDYK